MNSWVFPCPFPPLAPKLGPVNWETMATNVTETSRPRPTLGYSALRFPGVGLSRIRPTGLAALLFAALYLTSCNDFLSKNVAIGVKDEDSSSDGSDTGSSDDPNADDDGDGIANSVEEAFEMNTKSADSDYDGFSDALEFVGDEGDPLFAERTPTAFTRSRILLPADVVRGDPDRDGDGLGNKFETDHGLDPDKADTDDDGYNDGIELVANSDPFDSTDRPKRDSPPASDGINRTGDAPIDSDADGLANELDSGNGTLSTNADTDGDGFSDGLEYLMGSRGEDEFSIPNFNVPTAPTT